MLTMGEVEGVRRCLPGWMTLRRMRELGAAFDPYDEDKFSLWSHFRFNKNKTKQTDDNLFRLRLHTAACTLAKSVSVVHDKWHLRHDSFRRTERPPPGHQLRKSAQWHEKCRSSGVTYSNISWGIQVPADVRENTHARADVLVAYERVDTVLRREPEPDATGVSLIFFLFILFFSFLVASPRGTKSGHRACTHRPTSLLCFSLTWLGVRTTSRTPPANRSHRSAKQDTVQSCNPEKVDGWSEGGAEERRREEGGGGTMCSPLNTPPPQPKSLYSNWEQLIWRSDAATTQGFTYRV